VNKFGQQTSTLPVILLHDAASYFTKYFSPRQICYGLDSPKQQGCKPVSVTPF